MISSRIVAILLLGVGGVWVAGAALSVWVKDFQLAPISGVFVTIVTAAFTYAGITGRARNGAPKLPRPKVKTAREHDESNDDAETAEDSDA